MKWKMQCRVGWGWGGVIETDLPAVADFLVGSRRRCYILLKDYYCLEKVYSSDPKSLQFLNVKVLESVAV